MLNRHISGIKHCIWSFWSRISKHWRKALFYNKSSKGECSASHIERTTNPVHLNELAFTPCVLCGASLLSPSVAAQLQTARWTNTRALFWVVLTFTFTLKWLVIRLTWQLRSECIECTMDKRKSLFYLSFWLSSLVFYSEPKPNQQGQLKMATQTIVINMDFWEHAGL